MVDAIELSYMEALFKDYLDEQEAIVLARNYHMGEQTVYLTDRMKEFLNLNADIPFRLNVCRVIVDTLKDELSVIGFDTNEQADAKKQAEWALELWQSNRMDGVQSEVHEFALRDRETFVIVEWDDEKQRPNMVHNQVFTDLDADGDGLGCWMKYANDDPNQAAEFAVKQWTETVSEDGRQVTRTRRTFYFPDRIEKWVYAPGGWTHYEEEGKDWPIAWVDAQGNPLGIPVIHFKNANMMPEAWDAIPMQDAINKTLVDMLGTVDLAGFPMLKVFGFFPTTDGKALAADGSNQLKLSPMALLGSQKMPSEASLDKIPGEDPTPIMNTLKDLLVLTAMITSTPTSRFIITAQVAGEGSQKESRDALKKKARNRRIKFGDAWEDAMTMARKLANRYSAAGMDESVRFSTLWETSVDLNELKTKREALQIPLEQLWQEAGYSPSRIAAMKETDEYQAKLALMQIGLNNQQNG